MAWLGNLSALEKFICGHPSTNMLCECLGDMPTHRRCPLVEIQQVRRMKCLIPGAYCERRTYLYSYIMYFVFH